MNMSDSTVGARRKRQIKEEETDKGGRDIKRRKRQITDHLMIIYGVITAVMRGDDECISSDLRQSEMC